MPSSNVSNIRFFRQAFSHKVPPPKVNVTIEYSTNYDPSLQNRIRKTTRTMCKRKRTTVTLNCIIHLVHCPLLTDEEIAAAIISNSSNNVNNSKKSTVTTGAKENDDDTNTVSDAELLLFNDPKIKEMMSAFEKKRQRQEKEKRKLRKILVEYTKLKHQHEVEMRKRDRDERQRLEILSSLSNNTGNNNNTDMKNDSRTKMKTVQFLSSQQQQNRQTNNHDDDNEEKDLKAFVPSFTPDSPEEAFRKMVAFLRNDITAPSEFLGEIIITENDGDENNDPFGIDDDDSDNSSINDDPFGLSGIQDEQALLKQGKKKSLDRGVVLDGFQNLKRTATGSFLPGMAQLASSSTKRRDPKSLLAGGDLSKSSLSSNSKLSEYQRKLLRLHRKKGKQHSSNNNGSTGGHSSASLLNKNDIEQLVREYLAKQEERRMLLKNKRRDSKILMAMQRRESAGASSSNNDGSRRSSSTATNKRKDSSASSSSASPSVLQQRARRRSSAASRSPFGNYYYSQQDDEDDLDDDFFDDDDLSSLSSSTSSSDDEDEDSVASSDVFQVDQNPNFIHPNHKKKSKKKKRKNKKHNNSGGKNFGFDDNDDDDDNESGTSDDDEEEEDDEETHQLKELGIAGSPVAATRFIKSTTGEPKITMFCTIPLTATPDEAIALIENDLKTYHKRKFKEHLCYYALHPTLEAFGALDRTRRPMTGNAAPLIDGLGTFPYPPLAIIPNAIVATRMTLETSLEPQKRTVLYRAWLVQCQHMIAVSRLFREMANIAALTYGLESEERISMNNKMVRDRTFIFLRNLIFEEERERNFILQEEDFGTERNAEYDTSVRGFFEDVIFEFKRSMSYIEATRVIMFRARDEISRIVRSRVRWEELQQVRDRLWHDYSYKLRCCYTEARLAFEIVSVNDMMLSEERIARRRRNTDINGNIMSSSSSDRRRFSDSVMSEGESGQGKMMKNDSPNKMNIDNDAVGVDAADDDEEEEEEIRREMLRRGSATIHATQEMRQFRKDAQRRRTSSFAGEEQNNNSNNIHSRTSRLVLSPPPRIKTSSSLFSPLPQAKVSSPLVNDSVVMGDSFCSTQIGFSYRTSPNSQRHQRKGK